MSSEKPNTGLNGLLAALPSKDVASLYRRFERVELTTPFALSKPGKPIDAVYFLESGMISLMNTLEDGTTIEVGLVGREGFFGVPLVLGVRSTSMEAVVQATGWALRIPAKAFLAEIARNEKLYALLLRYAQALLTQVAQTAACNSRHNVPQRLAWWLLEANDRVGDQKMIVSHELLAFALGVRRSGVTMALGALKAAGVIDTGRGTIFVKDRGGLAQTACECYRTVRAEFRRLLPH